MPHYSSLGCFNSHIKHHMMFNNKPLTVPVVSNLHPWWDGQPRLNTFLLWIWCMFVHALLHMRREENQLDTTEWFIALVICSTCFMHLYPHHQELETILVLKPHMVCNALVAGGRRSGVGQQAVRLGWGKLLKQLPSSQTHSLLPYTWPPTTSNQGITNHMRFSHKYSLELLMMHI